MNEKRLYAAFAKIDEDKRQVFGYCSTEKRDQQGEITRLDAMRAALPDYLRWSNVREMHQPSAVGTAIEANIDDKGCWFGAQVVDDRAWNKVRSGVYKGFSIGGRVLSRDDADKTIITALELTEVSLVDRPANPEAVFQIVKRQNGVLLPQPVQKWDCGDASHQHVDKLDAANCMATELVRRAALPEDLTKREQPHLDTGKFGTHEAAATEAESKAAEHDGNATKFRAQEQKHRKNAEVARNKGDAQGVGIHEHLAGSSAALAEAHEASAKQYRDLAARHRATAEKLNKSQPEESHDMTVKVAALETTATAAIALLAGNILKAETDHQAELVQARNMGDEHDQEAEGHDAQALVHEKAGELDKMMGEQETAAHHRDLADGYHELAAHHMDEGKETPEVDHNKNGQMAKDMSEGHMAKVQTFEMQAGEHDKRMAEAKSMGNMEKSAHHEKMAKMLRKSAEMRKGMATKVAAVRSFHMDEAKKFIDTVKRPLAAHVEGQDTTSAAERGGSGTGKDPHYSDDTSLSDGFWKSGMWMGKREFSDKKRQELADKGHALPDGSFPIENKSDLENAVQAHGRAKDPAKAKAHIMARAKDLGAEGSLPDDWKKVAKAITMKCEKCGAEMPTANEKCQNCGHMMKAAKKEEEETDEEKKARKTAKVVRLGSVAKGMYIIARLAEMLDMVRSLQRDSAIEQLMEGDKDDTSPAKLESLMSELASCLAEIVANETKEMLADEDVEVTADGMMGDMVEMAAKASSPFVVIAGVLRDNMIKMTGDRVPTRNMIKALEKVGARHSKQDLQRIQRIHDHAMDLGATCTNEGTEKVSAELSATKIILDKTLKSITGMASDFQRMNKRIVAVEGENGLLKSQVRRLEDQPTPSKGKGIVTTSIRKAADGGNGEAGTGEGSLFEQAMRIPNPSDRNEFLLANAYIPHAK